MVLRHFAAIEAAEVCSVDALADRHGRSCPPVVLGTVRDIDNVWSVTSSLFVGCLPVRSAVRPVALTGCVMISVPLPPLRWLTSSTHF